MMAKNNIFKEIDWVMVLYFGLFLVLTQMFMDWVGLRPGQFIAKLLVESTRALIGFGISRLIFKKR